MASRATQYRPVQPASIDQRGAVRHRLTLSRATVRRHGGQPVEAELHDVSIYGCRVAGDLPFAEGERLWLRFEGGMPIAATIVWSVDGFTGCRFDDPIDRALMRRLTLVIC
ncbi:conserved hypothetical protein [Sphingomonas sp. EC-HK361]|uniref:PilZ domain-containing protein n=1 Tax=Sphingomonas sp. EC-HK361 TaxID=2038397 RepID=UPI001255B397|nr:PilZ domain-containing protein [Sphingomonas sp. EC-HK361]VVT11485.1 conserved hypothetical protein [Sphingomonas sp. EC-HK361]